MFPCSLRYFANVPLFPKTPGRPSNIRQEIIIFMECLILVIIFNISSGDGNSSIFCALFVPQGIKGITGEEGETGINGVKVII